MKKRISLILILTMLLSFVAVPSLAEEASPILESASGFYYIEAEGERPRLSAASQDKFMQVDGEWFKDLNNNGELTSTKTGVPTCLTASPTCFRR